MRSRDFCYWLQGYFEIAKENKELSLSPSQILCIEKHLNLVFEHEIDPEMGDDKHQEALNQIHSGTGGVKLRC